MTFQLPDDFEFPEEYDEHVAAATVGRIVRWLMLPDPDLMFPTQEVIEAILPALLLADEVREQFSGNLSHTVLTTPSKAREST